MGGLKITIRYPPGEARQAGAALKLLRELLPGARVCSSPSRPPHKAVYLAWRGPEKRPFG